jgi:DNA-binding response OmpR family regulator
MQTTAQSILIVECDLPTLELYQRELSRDYQILACSETQKALALLQTHPVSAVVLEPSTPDEQGWSLLAAIKSLPGPASIPVILCSTLDERKRGMEMGAVAYLVKPVLPTTLRETLRQITRRICSTR